MAITITPNYEARIQMLERRVLALENQLLRQQRIVPDDMVRRIMKGKSDADNDNQ